jgi:hypothetical protein
MFSPKTNLWGALIVVAGFAWALSGGFSLKKKRVYGWWLVRGKGDIRL